MGKDAGRPRRDLERQILEDLRAGYERDGYAFVVEPAPAQLPAFFGSYRPDALALKQDRKVAIELRRQPPASAATSLSRISKLFEDRPDWELRVVWGGRDPDAALTIPVASSARIHEGLNEARTLVAQGHPRAAFMIAWGLLEAALGSATQLGASRPRSAGTVVQALATSGLIEPQRERRLYELVSLWNRVIHGDFEASVTGADVEAVLGGVEQAITAEAA